MLNNSYKKIFIICCLFMNNSTYSMEDDMEFRVTTKGSQLKNSISDVNQINDSSKDRQIEQLLKQVNDLYDMNEINHEQIRTLQKQVKDLSILVNNITNNNKQIELLSKQVNDLSTQLNNSSNKQVELLSKQVSDLSTQVEKLNKEVYQNNQRNKFMYILDDIVYLLNDLEDINSPVDTIHGTERSKIAKFMYDKRFYGINIYGIKKSSQYFVYNEIIKNFIDKNLIKIIKSYHFINYTLSKDITDIDYFKFLNEINNAELNHYYVILENIKDNLILLHKNIPLQDFENSVFPSKLQSMIDEILKQSSNLQIIKGEYKELETQVLNLLNNYKSFDQIPNETSKEIRTKYMKTNGKANNMCDNFSKIIKLGFLLIKKKIEDESNHK